MTLRLILGDHPGMNEWTTLIMAPRTEVAQHNFSQIRMSDESVPENSMHFRVYVAAACGHGTVAAQERPGQTVSNSGEIYMYLLIDTLTLEGLLFVFVSSIPLRRALRWPPSAEDYVPYLSHHGGGRGTENDRYTCSRCFSIVQKFRIKCRHAGEPRHHHQNQKPESDY